MKKLILLSFALFTLRSHAGVYGDAGCGLGAMVMERDHQILAATTNESSGSQTFGISSDSSECIDARSVHEIGKVKIFIDANKQALAKDISRGNGETLAGLAQLLDCKNQDIGTELQKNYTAIFPQPEVPAAQVSDKIRSILRSHAFQCTYLG